MRHVLCYHEFTEERAPYLYSLPAGVFAGHVRVAQARGALITFDDGHRSQFDLALPALAAAGARGVFFITAGWTGHDPEMMNADQIAELHRLGHEIAAHGWSHKFLTLCSPAELERELGQARESLEQITGAPVESLSLPNGRWNRRVLEAAAGMGYRRVYGSYPWFPAEARRHAPAELELLGRRNIARGVSAAALAGMLDAGPSALWLPRLKWSVIRAARAALGDENYHRLWCLLARRDPEAESRRGRAI